MENNLTKFGDKIYNLRKQKNITQEEFGDMVGVSRQTVSQWEANVMSPKADKLQKICEVLNVDVGYFFENTNKSQIINVDERLESLATSDTADVACEYFDEQQQELQSPKKRTRLSKKAKVFIIVSVITLTILIVALIFNYVLKPKNDGFGVVIDRTYHLDALSVCWIVFIFAVVIIAIVGMCMFIKAVKRKNE